jgi:hypothetical protein
MLKGKERLLTFLDFAFALLCTVIGFDFDGAFFCLPVLLSLCFDF